MVDPVGAPTFAQMFSPAKSPFHALSLACLVALYTVSRKPLEEFGDGFILSILVGAYVLAPMFRPHYDDRVYGLSLVFGRSAGLTGALIAMTILIVASVPGVQDSAKLHANTPMFQMLWQGIMLQAIVMAMLFGCTSKPKSESVKRFNIIQFALMQSTLLIFIVALATGANDYDAATVPKVLSSGAHTLLTAPLQILSGTSWQVMPVAPFSPSNIIFALMFLWLVSGALNCLMLAAVVKPGWVSDHGEGESH